MSLHALVMQEKNMPSTFRTSTPYHTTQSRLVQTQESVFCICWLVDQDEDLLWLEVYRIPKKLPFLAFNAMHIKADLIDLVPNVGMTQV